MTILITGANGVVGQALSKQLAQSGLPVLAVVRHATAEFSLGVGEINGVTDWHNVLGLGVETVVHLAAKVPTLTEDQNAQAAYYHINTLGTANLAKQCAASGVKRFVFVSTAKVLGEGQSQRYDANSRAAPSDAYATSKYQAEQALREIAARTGMELVILRPPLVYGISVKGNFLRLLKAVAKHKPLPLGGIHNQRSLIYLGNLVDAIQLCLTHPSAAGKTYLLSDNDDVSTPELIRRMGKALQSKPLLLPIPSTWMQFAGRLLGKQQAVDRLLGSFALDITSIQQELGWQPPYRMEAGLAATAHWFRQIK